MLRSIFKTFCRWYPIERGKFKILDKVYFKLFAPKETTIVRTTLRHGIVMDLDVHEYLQAHLYIFGSYELPTVRFIRHYLKPGMTVIDVGAQIGYLTLEMAIAHGNDVSVYSFEPEPRNLNWLRNNLQMNAVDNVSIIDQAVSDADGFIKLYMSKDNNAGTHSTISDAATVSTEYIEIPCVRLDSFTSQRRLTNVGLIKVDVEGAELEVVRGAEQLLRTQRPALILEMCSAFQNARGFSVPQFKHMLHDWGYSPYTINDDGSLAPTPLDMDHDMDNIVFLVST